MRLTIKTLQQQIFEVEVEPSDTVQVLKEKIEAEKGALFPVAGQKLIYAGKILENEKTVEEYNIEPTKFIVAMVTKPKPAPAPKAEEAKTSTAASASSPSPAPTSTATATGNTSTTTPTTTTTRPDATPVQESGNPQAALVTNENYEETVLNIMAFGYPRDQVEAALAACYNNPDRAVDYLEGGEGVMEEMMASQVLTPPPTSGSDGPAAAGVQRPPASAPAGSAEMMREMIQNTPQLQQMVEQVRNNPEILQMYMEQMSQQNPELLRFISEHQSEFVNVINNSAASADSTAAAPASANRPPAGAEGVIAVTAQERNEIEQLKAMGFQEHECIEAYIACNKNVELAVNFLLSNM